MLLLTTDADALNEVIPGVTDAFDALRATNNDGIYTSNGAYYNHTVFGRDAALSGRFVCDFDHDLARDIIIRLARLQGYKYRQRNQEEPGRIHHEWRDFRTWKGRPMERLSVAFAGLLWGAHDHRLLTYYASDSTAEYIRLVEKYARRRQRNGRRVDDRGERQPASHELGFEEWSPSADCEDCRRKREEQDAGGAVGELAHVVFGLGDQPRCP